MPALANIFSAAQGDDARSIREVIEQTDLLDEETKKVFLQMSEIGFLPEEEAKIRNIISAYEQKKQDIDVKHQKKLEELFLRLNTELKTLTRHKKQEWRSEVEGIEKKHEEKELQEIEALFDEVE